METALLFDADADADNDGINVNLDVSASGQGATRCFLNLICIHAKTNADVDGVNGDALNVDADAAVDADEDSINVDADADLNTSEDNRCFLGLICLNANLNATSSNGVTATGAAQASLQHLWDSFVHIFASIDV